VSVQLGEDTRQVAAFDAFVLQARRVTRRWALSNCTMPSCLPALATWSNSSSSFLSERAASGIQAKLQGHGRQLGTVEMTRFPDFTKATLAEQFQQLQIAGWPGACPLAGSAAVSAAET